MHRRIIPWSSLQNRTERDLKRIERVSRQYAVQHKKEIRVMEDGYIEHEAILDNMKAVREELGVLKDTIKTQVSVLILCALNVRGPFVGVLV
jgi:hypothetical protein